MAEFIGRTFPPDMAVAKIVFASTLETLQVFSQKP